MVSPDNAAIHPDERNTIYGGTICIAVELDPKSSAIYKGHHSSKHHDGFTYTVPSIATQRSTGHMVQPSTDKIKEALQVIQLLYGCIGTALDACSKYNDPATTMIYPRTWTSYARMVDNLHWQVQYPPNPWDLRRCVAHAVTAKLSMPISAGAQVPPVPLFFRANGAVAPLSAAAINSHRVLRAQAEWFAAASMPPTHVQNSEQQRVHPQPIFSTPPCSPFDDIYLLGISAGSSVNPFLDDTNDLSKALDFSQRTTALNSLSELSRGVPGFSLQLFWSRDSLLLGIRPVVVRADRLCRDLRLADEDSARFTRLSTTMHSLTSSQHDPATVDAMLYARESKHWKRNGTTRGAVADFGEDYDPSAYVLPDADDQGEFMWSTPVFPMRKLSSETQTIMQRLKLIHQSWRALSLTLGSGCQQTACGCGCGASQSASVTRDSRQGTRCDDVKAKADRSSHRIANSRCMGCGDLFELWSCAYGIILPGVPILVKQPDAPQKVASSKSSAANLSAAPHEVTEELTRIWADGMRIHYEREKVKHTLTALMNNPATLLKPTGFNKLSSLIDHSKEDLAAMSGKKRGTKAKTTPAHVEVQDQPIQPTRQLPVPLVHHKLVYGVQAVSVGFGTDERLYPEPCVRGSELRIISKSPNCAIWSTVSSSIQLASELLIPEAAQSTNLKKLQAHKLSMQSASSQRQVTVRPSSPTIAVNGKPLKRKPDHPLLSKLQWASKPMIMPTSAEIRSSYERITGDQASVLFQREAEGRVWSEYIATAAKSDILQLALVQMSRAPLYQLATEGGNASHTLFQGFEILSANSTSNELTAHREAFLAQLSQFLTSTASPVPLQALPTDLWGLGGIGDASTVNLSQAIGLLVQNQCIPLLKNPLSERCQLPLLPSGFVNALHFARAKGINVAKRISTGSNKHLKKALQTDLHSAGKRSRPRYVAGSNPALAFAEKCPSEQNSTESQEPAKSGFILFCEMIRSKSRLELERRGQSPTPQTVTQFLLAKWCHLKPVERIYFQQKAASLIKQNQESDGY